MLFNSFEFAIFLPVVFLTYWFFLKNNRKWQNLFLLIASYLFYGWWDPRFLVLILFSTIVDYSIGINMSRTDSISKKKLFLIISLIVNLGILGFFKYYNFFLDNFIELSKIFGFQANISSLNIILPVGISFYTFQTLSYTIDIYRGKLNPTKDFITFAAFVSFFPQLVAGPIERATALIPQFQKERKFNYMLATEGLRQILWGLFKKMVIADNCAKYVNDIYSDYGAQDPANLLLASILFSFQIYGDFSGYSDIAIGTSRLFGFDLMKNFAFPYFSRDIAEFWRRWHISLSTWFRDYLYIPLGGSRGSKLFQIRNTFIIFIVSGFWHGANWTFIFWGFLNALFFLPLLLGNKNRRHINFDRYLSLRDRLIDYSKILLTFSLTTIAWVFFRSESIQQGFHIISRIFSTEVLNVPSLFKNPSVLLTLLFIGYLLFVEWIGKNEEFALSRYDNRFNKPLRFVVYFVTLFFILTSSGSSQQFIYFQF